MKQITFEALQRINNKEQQGYKDAFDTLYLILCKYIYTIVEDYNDTEEVVIKAFYEVFTTSIIYKDAEHFKRSLWVIAKNTALNVLKSKHSRNKRYPALNENECANLQEQIELVYSEEHIKILYALIDKLPSKCKQVMLLHLKGLHSKEISKRLNISVSNVDIQRFIGVKKLKEAYKNDNTQAKD